MKFKLNSDSIKMYDRCRGLRLETITNDPQEFKVFGTVHHKDGTESKQWKPMRKSTANLYLYAEASKAANQRFLDAMVDIIPVKNILDKKWILDSRTCGYHSCFIALNLQNILYSLSRYPHGLTSSLFCSTESPHHSPLRKFRFSTLIFAPVMINPFKIHVSELPQVFPVVKNINPTI